MGDLSATIITYHSIDNSGSVISIAPDDFRRQIMYLRDRGFRGVTLGQFVDARIKGKSLPEKTAVLTFDDGFQNFLTDAMPVLEEIGFTATVFLVTDRVGKYNDWRGNPRDLPRSKLLTWSEIKDLQGQGIEFGVHTKSHKDLTGLEPEELIEQIEGARTEMEDRLGTSISLFAYPYGKFNPSVKQQIEARYSAACSTNLGIAGPKSDLFALERVDAYYLANPRVLRSIGTKAFTGYLLVRQGIRFAKSYVLRN